MEKPDEKKRKNDLWILRPEFVVSLFLFFILLFSWPYISSLQNAPFGIQLVYLFAVWVFVPVALLIQAIFSRKSREEKND